VEEAAIGEILEVDEVLRRDFSEVVAGTVLSQGDDALDPDRLTTLLPIGPSASTPEWIGAADVGGFARA
jgi:hypothetical protein